MLIQVNYGDVDKTDAIQRFVDYKVAHNLERYADQITRVEVHLHDDKGGRNGDHDKRCVMEARPAGLPPFAVDHAASSLDSAINAAAGKLERAMRKIFDKRHDR